MTENGFLSKSEPLGIEMNNYTHKARSTFWDLFENLLPLFASLYLGLSPSPPKKNPYLQVLIFFCFRYSLGLWALGTVSYLTLQQIQSRKLPPSCPVCLRLPLHLLIKKKTRKKGNIKEITAAELDFLIILIKDSRLAQVKIV